MVNLLFVLSEFWLVVYKGVVMWGRIVELVKAQHKPY